MGSKVFLNPLRPTHVGYARRLKRILRDNNYDIVHNHMANYSGIGTWVGKRAGTPVITSFHNTAFPPETWTRAPLLRQARGAYSKLSMGYAVRRSDYVTGCSRATLQTVVPDDLRPTDRVLYYGVEVPPLETDTSSLRQSLGLDRDAKVVLHVGRLIEQKNHSALLRVFKQVTQSVENVHLLLVGDGPLREDIEQQINSLGLSPSVTLLGIRSDVPTLMQASDLLIFPSLHEGFGLVATEANAAGIPVVGSSIPGLTEAVEDGVTGFLHDLADEDAMAVSVTKLLGDPELAAKMGRAGRERVQREFTTSISARRLSDLYDECLSNR